MTLNELANSYLKNKKHIRLHLGCGPNVLPDWINVEGEHYSQQENTYIHNLIEQYPFPDNSVDEILAVHVIEHIEPNKVIYMLNEWLRILKPGGSAAVEWPDLLKMCQYIVDDPSRIYSDNKKIQKRSVAGIFGNIGKHKTLDMLHKWGYSQESMCILFKSIGFTNAIGQTPLFPKTEMDSRVIAYK